MDKGNEGGRENRWQEGGLEGYKGRGVVGAKGDEVKYKGGKL